MRGNPAKQTRLRTMGLALCTAAATSLGPSAERLAADDLVVKRTAFSSRLVLTGELVAESAVHIIVPNANIWPVQVRWLAEDGAEIAAGDTIVEFDNSQLASNLEQLEQAASDAANTLTSEEAQVRGRELQAAFELGEKAAALEKARIDAEVPREILSQKEYEERQLALQRANLEHAEASEVLRLERIAGRARIEKQRIALEKAEMAERRAREGIDLLAIPAPRSGVLLVAENPQEGRTFQTGDSSWPGTTLASLPDLETMIVEAKLFDVDDGRLEVGMAVTATIDAFPEETWEGEVFAIDSIAGELSRDSLRRAFRVRIELADLDVSRMLPGMSVQAVIERRVESALVVPRAALHWSEVDGALRPDVLLPGGDLVPVRLGECNPQDCELLEGLEEGARLAESPAGGS